LSQISRIGFINAAPAPVPRHSGDSDKLQIIILVLGMLSARLIHGQRQA
jgi:hypothetical protein